MMQQENKGLSFWEMLGRLGRGIYSKPPKRDAYVTMRVTLQLEADAKAEAGRLDHSLSEYAAEALRRRVMRDQLARRPIPPRGMSTLDELGKLRCSRCDELQEF